MRFLRVYQWTLIYGGPHVPRQEQIHHGKSKLLTARANYSRQNKNQITGQRFGQRLLHLPLYNFMLCKHYSLSVNIPNYPQNSRWSPWNETKAKQNKGNQAKLSSCSARIAKKKRRKVSQVTTSALIVEKVSSNTMFNSIASFQLLCIFMKRTVVKL
jgi:hypothetical protein